MISFKMRVMAKMLYLSHLIFLILSLCLVDATIEIYDHFGKKIDSFKDREAFDDDFLTMEGFLTASVPSDACSAVEPPSFLTNFTLSKFLLVNNSDACIFTTKVNNAEKAGYDVVIMYDSTPTPYQYIRFVPFPRIEFDIQLVFVSFEDGMIMKNNYLYNNSFVYNYRIKLKPNTPDITYYMYLFGAVIGVCFFVMLLFMTCLLIKCIQERRKLRQRRLSRRQLNQIPTAKFTKGDQFDVCAICLEDYNEGDKLRILPCSHAYHSKCIDPWLMNNRRNCPLCKRKIMFGDSGDESESEDSELASPAENTPLLSNGLRRPYWMTWITNPEQGDGSGPSTVGATNPALSPFSDTSSENPFLSEDDAESLLPPPHSSVNNGATNVPSTSEPDPQRVIVIFTGDVVEDSAPNEQQQRGLII